MQVRKALVHWLCNEERRGGGDDYLPTSVAEWEDMTSRKLETLVELVQHCLESDRAPVMQTDDKTGDLMEDPGLTPGLDLPGQNAAELKPDKIVVYSAFPSNNPLIKAVSFFTPINLQTMIFTSLYLNRS